nr:hypothetical protein [Calditrichia bacterium]
SIPDNMVWGMESALVDNNLYLLNGWRNGRGLNRQYDMGSGSWNYLASSVNPSSWGNTVEVWNNRLYLITIPEFVFEYDIAANTWTQKGNTPDLGFPGLRSVIVGDDIYVLGYRQHLFYKYTPASDTWTPLAEPPYSVAGCAMELYNGRIFCVGGSVDGGPHVGADIYKSVISYDILSDSWRYENLQISTPRIWMASAVYNDQLYVFGGFDSTAYAVDIVETLTPAPVLTGLAEDKPVAIPGGFTLEQNYPNPFNPTTSIGFSLPTAARVRLEIFDVLGRRLATPLGEGFRTFSAGRHEVRWNGRSQSGAALPSGIYFYRMAYQAAGGGQESGGELTRQMLLLK